MTDEYYDDLSRKVSDDERKLLREVLIRDENDPYEYIQAVEDAGNQTGLHQERTRQIVRTWENDGVCTMAGGPNLIKLTEFGKRVAHDLTDR